MLTAYPALKRWAIIDSSLRDSIFRAILLVHSPMDSSQNVQDQRQHHAHYDRRRQRKIERGALAAIKNVAGQASEWKVGLAEEHDHNSGDNNQ